MEHGHSMHEELLRVPFMVWGPGVTPGRESAPISIADVTPTILEAVGLEVPDAGYGQSIWPSIARNQAMEEDRFILAAGTLYGVEKRMAIRWPYKLIQQPKDGHLQLFDLEKDPEEKIDLIGSHLQIAQALAAELDQRLFSISSGSQGEGVEPDEEMQKHLRELGYLE
jgi:arylsulfatase A-like enzyme